MCVCADGRLARFELRGTRFHCAGGQPHVLSVVRDVTEREQAMRLLEQKVAERTRELTTLLEISNTVASTLELKSVLAVVLAEIQSLLGCTGATILSIDGGELVILDHRGPLTAEQIENARFPAQWAIDCAELRRDSPLIIDNVWDDSAAAKAFRASAPPAMTLLFGYARSLLLVPLKARDRLIGVLVVDGERPGQFDLRAAQLAWALANQAAVAIENARLYDQARELAAFEERQRLARELHDSVTQSLYTASMLGLALPTAWDRDPDQGRQMLAHLRDVTASALAELRTLLIELRPSVALQVELGELLRQLARALRSRIEIAGRRRRRRHGGAAGRGAGDLLSRGAGGAGQHRETCRQRTCAVTLRCTPESATMVITDDGPGFDVAEVARKGRTGLDVMRERAIAVGASLDIDSSREQGTRLTLRWPGPSAPRTSRPSAYSSLPYSSSSGPPRRRQRRRRRPPDRRRHRSPTTPSPRATSTRGRRASPAGNVDARLLARARLIDEALVVDPRAAKQRRRGRHARRRLLAALPEVELVLLGLARRPRSPCTRRTRRRRRAACPRATSARDADPAPASRATSGLRRRSAGSCDRR